MGLHVAEGYTCYRPTCMPMIIIYSTTPTGCCANQKQQGAEWKSVGLAVQYVYMCAVKYYNPLIGTFPNEIITLQSIIASGPKMVE